MENLRALAHFGPDAFQQCHWLFRPIASRRPGANHVRLGVRQRAHQGDGQPGRFVQRQDGPLVAQQHHGAARHVPCGFQVFRLVAHCQFTCLAGIAVGVLEEPQAVFHLQDAFGGAVNLRLGDLALIHQRLQLRLIDAALHVHVQAGVHRQFACVLFVPGKAVGDEFVDRGVVGHHEAGKAPLVAQCGLQELAAGGDRHAVQVVEAGHEGGHARLNAGLEGRQIGLQELPLGHVGCVVVAPGLRLAIGGEVLGASQDGVQRRQAVALEAAHPCPCYGAA